MSVLWHQIKNNSLSYFLSAFLLLLCFSCCTSIKKIDRIKFSFIIPLEIAGGNCKKEKIEFYVSYLDNYIIYELPFHITNAENNILQYDSIKYEYLIFNKNEKIGYLLKSITDTFKIVSNIDSILKERGFNGGKGDYDIFDNLEILNKKILLDKGNKKLFRYIFKNDYYDSAYVYFDKGLKKVSFSLSKSLDSVNESKLVKLQYFLKKDTATMKSDCEKDFFSNIFEISEEKSENTKALNDLYERFRKNAN